MKERSILHIDCNKFYASVEALFYPEFKDMPFAVGGDPASRHGIILTRNDIAGRYGVKTGEPLWESYQKCPNLIVVHPNYERYEAFSEKVNAICKTYSDKVERFGLDECWIDVTNTEHLFGGAGEIAQTIRRRVKEEIGITVSIGVSFNKIFAKLGSDYKKPDAITTFSRENFKEKVWPLPVSSLVYAGKSTCKELKSIYIKTIGDLAIANPVFLEKRFGKNILQLYNYANGNDFSPVMNVEAKRTLKSMSNSTTTREDMTNKSEIKAVFCVLAEHLSERLSKMDTKALRIGIYVRDRSLKTATRQKILKEPINTSYEITKEAFSLFLNNWDFKDPLRSIGISLSDFEEEPIQTNFFNNAKKENLEKTINNLKEKYGNKSVTHAISLLNTNELAPFGHNVFSHIQNIS